MRTFRDLIQMWPARTVFAREMGIGYEAAAGMYGRGFIHPHYWTRLLAAARRRKIKLSAQDLVAMSDRRKRRRQRKRRPAKEDAALAA